MTGIGRNDPCPCGSGRKYKKCCLLKQPAPISDLSRQRLRKTEGRLVEPLLRHAQYAYGEDFMVTAWEEFAQGFDWALSDETPEVETIFLPWVLYNWVPNNESLAPNSEWPEMTIAEHYLTQKARQLDDYTRRFIQTACAEPYSFFVVTEVTPNQSLKLKDLLLEREATVSERLATQALSPGDILYTRILSIDDITVMFGCAPTIVPPDNAGDLLAVRDALQAANGPLDRQALQLYDAYLRDIYKDIREAVRHPQLPQLVNTDGDPLTFITLRYELTCTPGEALEALKTLNTRNGGSEEEVLADAQYDNKGTLIRVAFPWLRRGNAQHASWDNTLLGRIVIEGGQLDVEVNSYRRATSIKRRIGQRLGRQKAQFVDQIEGSFDEVGLHESDQQSEPGPEDAMESPQVQAALAQMAQAHWDQWLDSPLPALDGKTPHEASKTARGRERLELLLLAFEGRAQGNIFDPDLETLRKALGLLR